MLTFHDLLDDMASSMDQPRAELLVLLIDRLRPTSSRDADDTHHRLRRLIDTLKASPTRRQVLHDYVLTLMSQFHQVSLYADSGMLGNEGFFPAMRQRLIRRVLPPVRQPNQLRDVFEQCFHQPSDARWVALIQPQDWSALWSLFDAPTGQTTQHAALRQVSRNRVLSALMLVSYRITAIGLEPALIRAYPAINEFKSPFLAQNREIIDYVEAEKARIEQDVAQQMQPLPPADPKPALVMLDQCNDILQRVKRNTRKQGVTIGLTNLLIRLEQHLARVTLLFDLLDADPKRVHTGLTALLQWVTCAQHEQTSVRALVAINTELLARQVTENASRMGEHYVSTDRSGFWRMYRSAAGAGLIIASMATLKVLTGRLVLAPFSRAVLYSLNYSFGFMLIHVLHFTVATKQPAMTAAALAATVQHSSGTRQSQLENLTQLIVNIMRTQFIAILGNISIAMPTGLLIAWAWQTQWHEPLLSATKAATVLHDIHPFQSLALFHAAIAGVWLFIAGLIAGYYDNLAVYHQVGPRLRQHVRLQRWLGQPRLDRMSAYVENNLGALAGNFWFGIFLGSTGTLGFILGLPIDIRHIAFASANLAQALFCLESPPSLGLVLISLLGVLMIGMTNLMVSFGLTLFVALRARRVQYAQWRPLLQLLWAHFLTRPSDFFWPPKPVDAAAERRRDHTRA
jgi:site-specific recombinase